MVVMRQVRICKLQSAYRTFVVLENRCHDCVAGASTHDCVTVASNSNAVVGTLEVVMSKHLSKTGGSRPGHWGLVQSGI